MRRRSTLRVCALAVAGLAAGCIEAPAEPDGNGESTTPSLGPDEVAYEELSETDQQFIDKTVSGHRLRWITEDGEQLFLEPTDDGYEVIEDPLQPEDGSNELRQIIDGSKTLIKDGESYGIVVDIGHGPYGWTFASEPVDTCEGDIHSIDEATEMEVAIIEELIDEGEVFVAEPDFSEVSAADYFAESDEIALFRTEISMSEDCVDVDGSVYLVELSDEHLFESAGYELAQIDR